MLFRRPRSVFKLFCVNSRFCVSNANDRQIINSFLTTKFPECNKQDAIYQLRWKDIDSKEIKQICMKHSNSHINAMSILFPEYKLLPWKFHSVPKNFWKDESNHRLFMDWYKNQREIEKPSQWKESGILKDIYKEGGRGLIKGVFNGSLPAALRSIYPNEDWDKVFRHPSGYWNSSNLRESLENTFGTDVDWRTISVETCKRNKREIIDILFIFF